MKAIRVKLINYRFSCRTFRNKGTLPLFHSESSQSQVNTSADLGTVETCLVGRLPSKQLGNSSENCTSILSYGAYK